MNISLPDELSRFVDERVAEGRYNSASDYVRALIQADERRRAEKTLEAALVDGLNTPDAILDEGEWASIRQEALSKLSQRRLGAPD